MATVKSAAAQSAKPSANQPAALRTDPPANPPTDPGPLHGLRVIEFGQFIAVPAAAQLLADLGADVIKIEPPGGDASRTSGWSRDDCGPMFTAYNRGKRSVLLDLRSASGRSAAQALAGGADVVLQNMRPGAMARLALDAARLMAAAPRLVYGQVSGFGQDGPAAVRPGFDIAAQAESGMMSLNGHADRDPTRVGFTVVDLLAARTLATGVLAALVRRGVQGRGGLVDVTLIDVAVEALANAWTERHQHGQLPLRRGNGQAALAPAGELLPTADGLVVVSAFTQDHFQRLCSAIGQPALAQDPRFASNAARVQHRAALLAALGDAMGSLSTDAVCQQLTAAGVVVGAVRTLDDVQAGRDGVASDLFVDVLAKGRAAVPVPGLPFRLDGQARRGGRLPGLGEHTDEVLAALAAASP